MDKETRKTQKRIAYVLGGDGKLRAKKDARGRVVAHEAGVKPPATRSMFVICGGRTR